METVNLIYSRGSGKPNNLDKQQFHAYFDISIETLLLSSQLLMNLPDSLKG